MRAISTVTTLDGLAVGAMSMMTSGHGAVAVYHLASGVYATEPWCLRCGSLLTNGTLDASIVACAGCSWRYDVTTGCVIGVAALRLKRYNVDVKGGRIRVLDT